MKANLLANIFCEGAILQRGKPVQVWGLSKSSDKPIVVRLISEFSKTEPSKVSPSNIQNKEVVVEEVQTMVSPKDNSWKAILSSRQGGPYALEVSTGATKQRVEDIYFGEVWICGGQSNMELPMSRVAEMFPHEITGANNPMIRQFKVPIDYSFNGPVPDVNKSEWCKASPDNIGDFSAVGYFFAKELYKRLQIPIGLVMTAVGGTPIEAWMSEGVLSEFPDSVAKLKPYKDEKYLKDVRETEESQTNNWYRKLEHLDIGLIEGWYEAKFPADEWKEASLTFSWDEEEELKGSGVVWFRYQVNVPSELVGKSAYLQLGCIIDADIVYVNGKRVGSTDYRYPPRNYPVTNLKEGLNSIAIRITVTEGLGGFVRNKPYKLIWDNPEESSKNPKVSLLSNNKSINQIPLDGSWKYKRSIACENAPGTTFFQWLPTGVFNNMIAPLCNYSIQGIIWYQGESNAGNPKGYGNRFTKMIEGWRTDFKQGEIPFLFVQLANWSPKGPKLNWALLRDEQSKVSRSVANTLMVVSYDVGEDNDLHPLDKETIGKRLAKGAFKKSYGIDVIANGPTIKTVSVADDKVILSFDNIGGGLTAKNTRHRECTEHREYIGNKQQSRYKEHKESLVGFSIWIDNYEIPAYASIVNNQVVLSSSKIAEASGVSYCLADNPQGNLYNHEGFPAEPFKRQLSKTVEAIS